MQSYCDNSTVFPGLYITIQPCALFITISLYLLNPLPFGPSWHGPTLWQPSLCTLCESVCFVVFVHLVFLESTHKWNDTEFVFLSLISLSATLSRSIYVATNSKISFFLYSWVCMYIYIYIFVYTDISHLLYPFIMY